MNELGSAPGGGTPSTDPVHELRAELLALRETSFVNQKKLLQLQDAFFALRREWSAVQPGGGMAAMDHIQVLRNEVSGLREALCCQPKEPLATSGRFARLAH